MRNFYDVIEIDNYVNLNTLQNFNLREYSICVYQVGLKHARPNIGKTFEKNIILITKYLNHNWNIVKSFIFYQKMIDLK